jgi:3-oxoacyl-[acyl-carrier-protein] synthase-3
MAMLRETEAPTMGSDIPAQNGNGAVGEVTPSHRPQPAAQMAPQPQRTTTYAQITGWGMYVPSQVVPNEEFVKLGLDTSDEWISSRTGVRNRHFVRSESTSDMAVRAANEALHVAQAHGGELDLVIVATCTPDHIMPSTASIVQDRLGARNAGAMDLNAACSGFVYALTTGAAFIESGRASKVLIIGADELSIHLNWADRSTCVLFGDGAGAVVLEGSAEAGLLASDIGSDGSGAGLLTIPAGSRYRHNESYHRNGEATNGKSARPAPGVSEKYYLQMNGPQIYRWATQMMAKASEKVMTDSGLTAADVDLYIPHQANLRIMETTAKRLGLPIEKVFSNVQDYGNTSAASIPIALYEAISSGRVNKGDDIIMTSFGAGLSWAAVALRWGVELPLHESRWQPIRREVDRRMAALRSALRREQWRVRRQLGKRFNREDPGES